jgi:hypothetical protein
MNATLSSHLEVTITYGKVFYDDFYETISRIYGFIEYRVKLGLYDYNKELRVIARDCEDIFSRGLLIKMNKQSFFDYYYESHYLTIRLYRMYA